MKKLLVVILIVTTAVGFIFYQNFSKKSENNDDATLAFNGESGKWEEIKETPRINREELVKNSNEDGFSNMSILRGYFDSYDEKNGVVVIKSLLPFTMGRQFEVVKLKAPINKIIYCAPKTIIVPKTGKEILTQSLTFPVKNEETLSVIYERIINFDKFIQEAKEDTYLFIQLTQDFDKENENYIKKLVVIGLCD